MSTHRNLESPSTRTKSTMEWKPLQLRKRLPPPCGHLIGICLPSRAPGACGKFHLWRKMGLDLQPVFRTCGACHHLISIGPGDSVTDLRPKLLDGRTGHPESILQSGVAVTSGEMSEGYCQIDSWTHWICCTDPLLQALPGLAKT